ncbi:hypothetical protein [Marinobacter sp. LV10R520-4]|nr:hypothetical protein [Marinobacter sp. LV10R520-4]
MSQQSRGQIKPEEPPALGALNTLAWPRVTMIFVVILGTVVVS